MSPPRLATCGLVADVQLAWNNPPTGDRYVRDRAWEYASLDRCPFHSGGRCRLQKLGSYPRVWPVGARVPRFWCPVAGRSVSLLPDFLAARMPGSLDEVEAVVDAVERAGGIARAVDQVRAPDVDRPVTAVSAQRFIQRRLKPVRAVLRAAVTILPQLSGCPPELAAVRRALGVEHVLRALRHLLAPRLAAWPPPLGFCPRSLA